MIYFSFIKIETFHSSPFSLPYSAEFIRQDSLRSDYLSDRESRYGIVQQASIDSTDSRMCYLTSSEVSAVNVEKNMSYKIQVAVDFYFC